MAKTSHAPPMGHLLAGRRVLVTGGAGFIGSHLVDALVAAGASVAVIDNLETGKKSNIPEARWVTESEVCEIQSIWDLESEENFPIAIKGSINVQSDLELVVDGTEFIFHLAAIASVARSFEEPELHRKTNFLATADILRQARMQANFSGVVFASSAAIYGNPVSIPVAESHSIAPLSPYGEAKAASDRLMRGIEGGLGEWATQTSEEFADIPRAALRFFNVYGPRQDPSSPYSGVLSIFSERISKGDSITIFGDGEQTRDFVHVSDVVNALMRTGQSLIDFGQKSPCHRGGYNVATGVAATLNEVIDIMSKSSPHPIKVRYEPAREGDIRHSVGDASSLKEAIGWVATNSLRQGLITIL